MKKGNKENEGQEQQVKNKNSWLPNQIEADDVYNVAICCCIWS